ncbi:MAG: PQQ-dependent sugar dehydrogenase [Daejeonella sp.]|uniref:PQQ-dependent sugar dehydrogenase n=1 Tax=Daejeonella sp. TaxID=2805397 RepID=UPI003C758922
MRSMLLVAAAAGIIVLSGCSKSKTQPEVKPDPVPGEASVETLAPNATYTSAFVGQTRIKGVKTTTTIIANAITSSLTAPWGITTLPDGRLLITQRTGGMRIVTTAGVVSSVITGIPAVNSSGQGGLLGLTIDPAFATNRMIYWVFSEAISGGTVTSVAKGRLASNETSLENVTVIYRSNTPTNGNAHYGGRVVFDRTGNLIVSSGERADNSSRVLAQSVTSSLGKIIRITTNGQPAPGNPVFSQSGALPELYSMGHRNPQGLAIHPVTGNIWQSEHGPRGGDEVNQPQGGKNYGWPTITYGLEYSGQRVLTGIQQQSGLEQPIYYWDPVVSPSGMTFYSGNRIAEWQNNLFIGSLSGMHIIRLVIENDRVVGEERLLATEGQRFRDITQGTDNALYAITDAGRLYRIDRN